ncbi:MAG: S8 family serine peptidase [Candidatus Nanopelagicales bacterium]
MTQSRFAVGFVAVALLIAPLGPAAAQDSSAGPADEVPATVEPVVPGPPDVPTLGADIPPTPEPASDQVSAVVRTDDGTVEVATAPDAAALAEETAGDSVLAVDRAAKRYAMALPAADDKGRDLQWGLNRLQAEDLWQRSTGSGVTVAVLDTGVKASHPDLSGRVARGFNAITNKRGARKDNNGHGTFLAGMIAGKVNGVGIEGLAPNARILPVKVLDSEGVGDSDDIARGIIWAVDNGADVINMSFGADSSNRVEAEAIDYARGAGVTLVAAGGNLGVRMEMYPAAYPGVLGVAATDFNNERASFSNKGPHIDVAAPGQGILSTFNSRPYTWTSGTSMSTAYVSAVAALAMSYSPGAGGEPLQQQIMATARDIGPAGSDAEFGAGLVDPAALLEQEGAGRAPGMPVDIAARGTGGGNIALTFTPPAGTTFNVQFRRGTKAPTGPYAGSRVSQGQSTGAPVTVNVSGKNPKKYYAFSVFTSGPTGTSRAIATVRPLKWKLTRSKSVPRNSRQKLEVGVRVPTFGWIGGWPLQLTTQQGGKAEKVRRFVPTSDGPDTFRVRDLRWSFHYQFTMLAPGFWNAASPRESQWINTSVTAKRNGRISGRVTPSKARSEVQLQRKAGKKWKTIKTTKAKRNGRYAFPGRSGTLRVYAPADLWHGPASQVL